jgi:hypothetical protein
MRNTLPHQEVLGNGFELQTAQVSQGNEADTLAFYAQTLPAAGTPIRFHSFESQAAISRLQASGSIAQEAYIVGDDGIRSAIISNLNPLPRTSEDCDAAAQAYLDDRTQVFYNGTYNCTSYFFNNLTSDTQFFPTCGRYLYVNSPARGISKQWMLVTQLTISVLDAVGNAQHGLAGLGQVGEVLHFSVGFGADLHLEKVLYNFVDIQPTNVLTNTDTATPPNPMYDYQIDNAYQPDLSSIRVNPITDTEAQVTVYDAMVAPIEIRLEDANWGQGATPDYVGTATTSNFTLVRQQFEQIWYMRFVDSTTGTYSRRSKVVRIYYPVTPLAPTLLSADSNFLQFDFNGDIRNVYGFELRTVENVVTQIGTTDGSEFGWPSGTPIYGPPTSIYRRAWGFPTTYNQGDVVVNGPGSPVYISLQSGNQGHYCPNIDPTTLGVWWAVQSQTPSAGTLTPIVQKPCESIGDLLIDLTQTINTYPFSSNRQFYAYFFNHQWSYSQPTIVTVPPPNLTIEEGYRFGQSLNLLCVLPTEVGVNPTPRTDLTQQVWQIAADSDFSSTGMVVNQTNYTPGSQTFNVPATGDIYARSLLFDYISSGSWSPTIHIPLGNLIASDYLAAQGSAPPILTSASGALASYVSSTNVIEVSTVSFVEQYPNGQTWTIPTTDQTFTTTKDTLAALTLNTPYYFYLSMQSAAYTNPTVFVDGPYQNPSQSALAYTVADGRVQLSAGALAFYTSATPTGSGGGGGGGTGGGGQYCGVLSSMMMMADGSQKKLGDTVVGDVVSDGHGGIETVVARKIIPNQVVRLVCAGLHKTRVADGHTLKVEYGWESVVRMEEAHERGDVYPVVDTIDGMHRITDMHRYGLEDVCHLQLSGPRHTYVLDGFVTHNILIKTEAA